MMNMNEIHAINNEAITLAADKRRFIIFDAMMAINIKNKLEETTPANTIVTYAFSILFLEPDTFYF